MDMHLLHSRPRGFTLLELLLVVGIAAILIIAGVTTYSLVSRSNQANETTRFINLVLEAVRKSNQGQPTFATTIDFENAIATGNMIPSKYINGAAVITPSRGQIGIDGSDADWFDIQFEIPGRIAASIAQNFDPRNSEQITRLDICGIVVTDATPMGNDLSYGVLAAFNACDTDANTNVVVYSR